VRRAPAAYRVEHHRNRGQDGEVDGNRDSDATKLRAGPIGFAGWEFARIR
jgi:hypothetical protein